MQKMSLMRHCLKSSFLRNLCSTMYPCSAAYLATPYKITVNMRNDFVDFL